VRNGRISDATVVLEQFSHPFSLTALPLSAEKICGICLLFESQKKKKHRKYIFRIGRSIAPRVE